MVPVSELPLWARILLEEGDSKKSKTCLVLIAHGSKDPRWREPFERLYLSLRSSLGHRVRMGYMEFVNPTLMDLADECSQGGMRKIRVLPLFMAAGAHLATDIPEQVKQVRERHPRLEVEVLAPIGEDPRMFALMQQIVNEIAA